jgi:hypothetical protein
MRMEGYTVEEIARRLKRVPRSVKRKLGIIRRIWKNDLPPGRTAGADAE